VPPGEVGEQPRQVVADVPPLAEKHRHDAHRAATRRDQRLGCPFQIGGHEIEERQRHRRARNQRRDAGMQPVQGLGPAGVARAVREQHEPRRRRADSGESGRHRPNITAGSFDMAKYSFSYRRRTAAATPASAVPPSGA